MLSARTKAELRRELARLKGVRETVEQQITAIRGLLGPDGRLAQARRRRGRPNSLASQIRESLAAIGRAANAREISERLERQGITRDGATSLKVYVGAELFRMAQRRTGGVVRVRRGLYRIEARPEE